MDVRGWEEELSGARTKGLEHVSRGGRRRELISYSLSAERLNQNREQVTERIGEGFSSTSYSLKTALSPRDALAPF